MKDFSLYLRAIVFGISDSLVSTVGLLAGIDISGVPHSTIALTGLVYAFVEAFSMAVGNFLSEETAEEYAAKSAVSGRAPIAAGVVMFVTFVVASCIPLVPYLVFGNWIALAVSVIASIAALFVVGAVSGRLAKLPILSRGLRMALLGGAAILIGAVVGVLIPAA